MSEDSKKAATGATVYLVEELSDARMRCDQLIRYVGQATRLVEDSPHREAVFESAGHLIFTIPRILFRLQKALQAAALATNKLDSEEIKADLRPEKVHQLDDVLKDVRIRQVQRRSEPNMVNPNDDIWNVDTPIPRAAAHEREYPKMNKLAQNIAGALDVIKRDGEALLKEMHGTDMSQVVSNIDERGVQNLLRAATLARKELFGWGGISFVEKTAKVAVDLPSEEEGGKPKYDDHFKAGYAAGLKAYKADDSISIHDAKKAYKRVSSKYGTWWIDGFTAAIDLQRGAYNTKPAQIAKKMRLASMLDIVADDEEDKQSRFEEGKPADPTKNMSPEDKAKWHSEKEKHKDEFKSASVDPWEAPDAK